MTDLSNPIFDPPIQFKSELRPKGRFVALELLNIRCEIFDFSDSGSIALNIESDFPFLVSESGFESRPHIRILIENEIPRMKSLLRIRTSLGTLHVGRLRFVEFSDGGSGSFEFHGPIRIARFDSRNSVDVIENFILASFGELLERNGYFRLHAAGILESSIAEIFVAPSGAGKSTLVSKVLRRGNRVYSDEIVLIKNDVAYPFPIPLAVDTLADASRSRRFLGSTKPLFSIQPKSVAPPAKVERIVFVTNVAFPLSVLHWMVVVTLGLGLPQMKEYLLRFNASATLVRFAVRRFAFALSILTSRRLVFQTENQFRSRP